MRIRNVSLAATAFLVMFLALSSSASVIDQSADAVSNTYGWTAVGQTFTSPGGSLNSWKFWSAGSIPTVSFYVCSGDVQGGCSALYSTTLSNVGPGSYTVSGLNVATTAGNLYSVLYDLNGYGQVSILFSNNSYPGRGGWGEWGSGTSVSDQWGKGLGTGFVATFGPTTPEPGTFVLLGSGMLAGLGVVCRKLLL